MIWKKRKARKMHKLVTSLFIMLFVFTGITPVYAISDSVNVADLPEYTRNDNFELSFSSLSDSTPTVRFFYKKDGGSYSQFGPTLNTYSGTVQVTGSQIQEQAKYFFRVEINGATSDETSTSYDISGPSPVQNYRKEMIGGGHYRLFWKNPGDSDFSRTFIYRSTQTEFSADGSTKIGELGGAPDQEMTFDNTGLDPNMTYYYALRAVDKAGNAASIVADPEVTTTIVTETVVTQAGTTGEGEVVVLPQEGDGQVLGEGDEEGMDEDGNEIEMIESPTPEEPQSIAESYNEARATLFNTARGRLALFGALLLGAISYFIWRRRS
jgi:hypothetical protein